MFAVLQLDCSQPELLWLKIGQMHNETNLGPRSANFAAPGKRNAPTTAEPVLRSGNHLGADGLPCRAGFMAALHRCAVRHLGQPGRRCIDNDKRRQRLTGIDSHSLLKSHTHLA